MIISDFDNDIRPKYIWVINDVSPPSARGCLGQGMIIASDTQTNFPDLTSFKGDNIQGIFPLCPSNGKFTGRYCYEWLNSQYWRSLSTENRYFLATRFWNKANLSSLDGSNKNCKIYSGWQYLQREIVLYKKILPCPTATLPACPPGFIPKKIGTEQDPVTKCMIDKYVCAKKECYPPLCCLVDENLRCLNFGGCPPPSKIVPAGEKYVDGCRVKYYKCVTSNPCTPPTPPLCPVQMPCYTDLGWETLPNGCAYRKYICRKCNLNGT